MRRALLASLFFVGCATSKPAKVDEKPTAESLAEAKRLRIDANAAYEAKDYGKCIADYQKARAKEHGEPAAALYNVACCQALAGKTDDAFKSLDEAVTGGFHDAEHLKTDTDLSSLHGDDRWTALVFAAETAHAQYEATLNKELLEMYEADQAARTGGPNGNVDWKKVNAEDAARRKRAKELVDAGLAKVSDDYFHAAMIMQHGSAAADYERAWAWALKAVELDPMNATARWLAAAALDRKLMFEGKPQKYGTQFKKVAGRWFLYEVDPTVTDAERAEWNVPPLESAKQRAERLNAH